MNLDLTNDEIKELLSANNIPIINSETNYWFVRTSAGKHFEDFYFGQYIAIGWDKLNDLDALKTTTKDQLKDTVIKLYPDDSRPGNTASQILRFINEIKIGDYILIPNESCERISIGLVSSDVYLYQPTEQDKLDELFDGIEIDFLKRRNVKWITESPLRRWQLDPMLIPIIYSYGTIVDANPYSQFINRSIYDIYYRNGKLHAIFNMTKPEDISAYHFNKFISSIFASQNLLSSELNVECNPDDFIIKASFNSAGSVEIITTAISALLVISSISLFINGAKIKFKYNIFKLFEGEINISSPGLLDKIKPFIGLDSKHKESLEQIENDLSEAKDHLEIKGKDVLKKNFSQDSSQP